MAILVHYDIHLKYLLIEMWIILKWYWNISFRSKLNLSNMIAVARIMWFILFAVSRFNCFFNFLKRHTFYKLMTNNVMFCPNFPTIDKYPVLIFPKQYLWLKTNMHFVKQFIKSWENLLWVKLLFILTKARIRLEKWNYFD